MNFDRHYRRDGTLYPAGDAGLFQWAKDLEAHRPVLQEMLHNGYWVSTVWLGLDHNFSNSGPPLIFETMVKNPDGGWEDFQDRYATEDDAIIGHLAAVDLFKGKSGAHRP